MEVNGMKAVEQQEKKIQFLQYINTAILTFIGTIATILLIMISNVQDEQIRTGNQMVKFQVMQDHNTVQIDDVDARVKVLEITNLQDIKSWIDLNYVRKPQK